MSTTAPLPPGFGVALDPSTQALDGGRTLLGGSPLRLLRLTDAGARTVSAWQAGAAPRSEGERRLARRLLDAGIAHPLPGAAPALSITVVVPVRDRAAELADCLAALDRDLPVLVVEDGSRDPQSVARVARDHGARVLHRPTSGGAGAARNDGWDACETDLVAFVDSDCVPGRGWLDGLGVHFADPTVAAVAPRITDVEDGEPTWLSRYEAARSPLDLGPEAAYVRPGSKVSYLPAAALVVRRTCGLRFDPTLMVGEDVDLVWRLVEAGHRVRYEPSVTVAHRHRTDLWPLLRRRFDYGTSAGPLAQRHPGRLPALAINPWSAAAWAALADRRPLAAGGLTAVATGLLARRLRGRVGSPYAVSARLAARGTVGAGRLLGSAVSRSWLPLAVAAAVPSRRIRPAVGAALVVPALLEWGQRRPALDPLRWTAASLLDDAAYCAGVWRGCARERILEPLLPSWRAGRVGDLVGGPVSDPVSADRAASR